MTPDTLLHGSETTECAPNRVRFVFPALPASVNGLYQIIWHKREVELKPECRQYKSRMKDYVPLFSVGDDSLIQVDVVCHYNYWYKNGKLREFDTHNLIKLLIDTCAERLGMTDKRMKRGSWDSVDSTREQVEITLTEYPLIRKQG